MLFAANSTSLIQRVLLTDDNGDPITGVAFDSGSLALSYNLQAVGAWVTPTLVDGTLGVYLANSWKEIGGGIYQWCPPNAVVAANTSTLVRAVYGANDPQYDTIEARLPAVSAAGAVELDSGATGDTSSFSGSALAQINAILSTAASVVVNSGIEIATVGFPSYVRIGDARTTMQNRQITLRVYDIDDPNTPLTHIGSLALADADLKLSFTRPGEEIADVTLESSNVTFVISGLDAWIQIVWDADAIDALLPNLSQQYLWGVKALWPNSGSDEHPVTLSYGKVWVRQKIAPNV